MARYLDVMGDVFSVPDPESVAALSASFQVIAMNIGDARSGLDALGWAEWTGLAADTFAGKMGELPGQLGQAWDSYTAAARALSDYASKLIPVVSALSALASEAEDAEGVLRGTITARNQIIQEGQDPQATGWDARLWEAKAHVAVIERRMFALRAELDDLSGQCVTQIRRAQAEGIQNNLVTDFQRYALQDVLVPYAEFSLMADRVAAEVILNVAEDLLIKPFTDLITDTVQFAEDPSWETFGEELAAVAAVLGLLSLLVPGLGEFVAPLLLGAALSEATALATHEPGASLGKLGVTMLSLGVAGTGALLKEGVNADDSLLQAAYDQHDPAQIADLAYSSDSPVSGTDLLKTGVKQMWPWDQVRSGWSDTADELSHPVTTLNDDAYALSHWGVEPYTRSPAAVGFQRVNFALDRMDNLKDVLLAEHQKGHLK